MIEVREWHFQVSCRVEENEQVCLTGSCDELGSWMLEKVVPLEPETLFTPGNPDRETIWKASIKLPLKKIKYRYCICSLNPKNAEDSTEEFVYVVRNWETHLQPRIIPENESNSGNSGVDIFGISGGLEKTDQGWLTSENLVQIFLYYSSVYNNPVALWKKKHKDKKCFVKITPINMNGNTEFPFGGPAEESTEIELAELRLRSAAKCPIMEVSVMKEGFEKFRPQNQFGLHLEPENGVIFQCKVDHAKSYAFLVDYYIEMNSGSIPHYIGCSYILPANLKETMGAVCLPITSQKHLPIGELTAHYVITKPMEGVSCNMEVSYARYWKNSWKGIEVGHRGAGNSFHSHTKNCANIQENTIASLIYAAENGADMVEFDVQLSKDYVPVLYHNYHAFITLKKRKEPLESDLMFVPIKELTLDQLQALKIYHKSEKGTSRFSDDDNEDYQPFPTLEKAMERVPESCGFNIEVKYNMRMADGSVELKDPLEANKYIDFILKVVLNSHTRRRIVLSCFNPNICTMLRMKQNKFPVLFLTDCRSFEDFRSSSLKAAIYFASSIRILGVNPNSAQILNNTKELESAFQHKLVVFCWGDQNADRAIVDSLIRLGLHGIIYDNIDVHNTKSNKGRSIFLCEEEEDSNCILFSNGVQSPLLCRSFPSHLNGHEVPRADVLKNEKPTNFKGILTQGAANNISVS